MPESVKISELPVLSSVQPNDIIPVVDEFVTQTSRCKASQIAALGGGPPAVNSVSTDKLVSGAVTAEKIGFTGPDKLISRIAAGAGAGVEIPCTAYARGLIASVSAAQARQYLDALQSSNDPIFSGQVQLEPGTAAEPSLVSVNDLKTGLYFPSSGSLAFSNGGYESFRIDEDGTIVTPVFSPENVNSGAVAAFYSMPTYGARAYAVFSGQLQASALQVTIGPSARLVGQFFGRTQTTTSIRDDAQTRAAMIGLAAAAGYNLAFPTSPSFIDAYGKQNPNWNNVLGTGASLTSNDYWPAYNRGTERRANYTTPSDDRHWYWNGVYPAGGWALTSKNVTGQPWIGYITLTSSSATATQPIFSSAGIRSIVRGNAGDYTVNFSTPFPDTNYAVVAYSGNAIAWVTVPTANKTTASCKLVARDRQDSVNTDPSSIVIAIYR